MFRAYADNVVVKLDPVEKLSKGGIHIPDQSVGAQGYKRTRIGQVVASGPGYYGRASWKFPQGCWHPNEIKEGDRVILDFLAGQAYDLDISAPRHNKKSEFLDLMGEKGEFRFVREQQILGKIEDGKVIPLGEHLIVERSAPETTTEGGIIIPDTAKDRPLEGKVLLKGAGRMRDDGERQPLQFELCDMVLFGKYCGTEVELDGDLHLLLREDDVLGVIEQ